MIRSALERYNSRSTGHNQRNPPWPNDRTVRWEVFRIAFLSGLAKPVGALIAALFLASFTGFVPGALAFAGGVMMFITLDELIPAAREHGHHHTTALGIIFGAIFVILLSGIFGVKREMDASRRH